MRAVLVGLGAEAALHAAGAVVGPATGEVVASFDKALYARSAGGLAALVGPSTACGPLHVVLDRPPPRAAAGTPVRLGGHELRVGGTAIALKGARSWRGPLPAGALAGEAVRAATAALAPVAARSALHVAPFVTRLTAARGCLARDDLAGVAGALGGVGPGLTPSGDDALAGVLLAGRLRGGSLAEAALLGVAEAVRTTEISAAFLYWAARGQSLAPVHVLLAAADAGDVAAARAAGAELGAVGASSGADLALGLHLGLRRLRSDQQRLAA